MISLTQETIPEYFTIANSENSWIKTPTNLYNFISRHSDKLLVTIGDSWTWGSDIAINNIDDAHRVRSVFGNILSHKLSSDWLNLAISAQGNFWITEMVRQVCHIVPNLKYTDIVIVCTFTGIGRWFDTIFDRDIDYNNWFDKHISCQEDFDKLPIMLNEICVDRILSYIAPHKHISLKIGTNFVDHVGFDKLSSNQILHEPWYRVLGIKDEARVYNCVYHDRLAASALNFIKPRYHSEFKQWFLEIESLSTQRLRLLSKYPKFRNYHPLAEHHLTWAEYIAKNLNE